MALRIVLCKLNWGWIRGWLGYKLARPFHKLTGTLVFTTVWKARDLTHGIDYGIVGFRCVTQLGVAKMMGDWHSDTSTMYDVKYFGYGIVATAENTGDTTLYSEVETRDGATMYLGGAGNSISFVTTHTYASAYTLREIGLLSALSNGTLWDRTVLSPTVTVAGGTAVEWTYVITAVAGG